MKASLMNVFNLLYFDNPEKKMNLNSIELIVNQCQRVGHRYCPINAFLLETIAFPIFIAIFDFFSHIFKNIINIFTFEEKIELKLELPSLI